MQDHRESPAWQEQKKTNHTAPKKILQIKQNLDIQARLAVLGMLRDKRNFCEALLLADGNDGTIEDVQRKAAVIDYIDALSEEIEESAKALFEGRQTKSDHK